MSGSGADEPSVDLLRHLSCGDDAAAEGACRSLCEELMVKAAACEEEEAWSLMDNLQKALAGGPSQQVETLMDCCALDLCAPVIVSGALGPECARAATKLLQTIADVSPARDAYTGIVEGVSMAPPDYWNNEGCQIAQAILKLLPNILSRITRKKASYLRPIFEFILQLLKKITDSCGLDDGVHHLVASLETAQKCIHICGYEVQDLPTDVLNLTLALTLLLSDLLLPLAVMSISQDMSRELDAASLELLRLFADFVTPFGIAWNNMQCAQYANAWLSTTEDSKPELTISLDEGARFLFWGGVLSEHLKGAIKLETTTLLVMKTAAEMCSTASSEAMVIAGLQILGVYLENKKMPGTITDDDPALKSIMIKLLNSLVDHMHKSSSVQVKIYCHASIQAMLKCMSDEIKWVAFQTIILCPYSEVAAVLLQEFKSAVVEARTTHTDSIFNSTAVMGVITQILQKYSCSCDADKQTVGDHAELLATTLNLYRYLCLTARNSGSDEHDIGSLSEANISIVNTKCMDLKRDLDVHLAEVAPVDSETADWMMAIQRLDEVISRVLELISTFPSR